MMKQMDEIVALFPTLTILANFLGVISGCWKIFWYSSKGLEVKSSKRESG